MSQIVIEMEMPKRCIDCEWYVRYEGDYVWCHACRKTGRMPIENAEKERAKDCPLRELPPHGRLIDADALQEYYEALDSDNGDYTESASETAETIANAPTILEASR